MILVRPIGYILVDKGHSSRSNLDERKRSKRTTEVKGERIGIVK